MSLANRRRRVVATIVGISMTMMISVGQSGCAGEPSAPSTDDIPQAYVDLVDSYLDVESLSDFQRGVLRDYHVTDDELQEAKDRYLECVADKGYTGEFFIRGTQYSATLSAEDHRRFEEEYQDDPDVGMEKEASIFRTCSIKTVTGVADVYAQMTANPDDKSFAELARQCLEKIGVRGDADAVADDDLRDAIDLGQFGADARAHCLWGAYVDTPMWVSDDAG